MEQTADLPMLHPYGVLSYILASFVNEILRRKWRYNPTEQGTLLMNEKVPEEDSPSLSAADSVQEDRTSAPSGAFPEMVRESASKLTQSGKAEPSVPFKV